MNTPTPTLTMISGLEKAVVNRVIVGNITLDVILIASVWGSWPAVLGIVACDLLRGVVNGWADKHYGPDPRGIAVVFPMNSAINLLLGAITGWNTPFVVAITYFIVVGDLFAIQSKRWAWFLTPASLVVTAITGAMSGRSAAEMVTVCAVVALTASFVRFRARRLSDALEEVKTQHARLATAHEQLQQLQRRLLEQEKLSGLGQMAAGIAHEINNPMSFVTANLREISAWMKKNLDQDDPDVADYVKDVLPATLDGANRVNAIVADLRRFARAEDKADVPFDINDEIKIAARIATSTIKHRSSIELDLASIPPVTGHPQQMTQVFVNLFVNAAQAMDESHPGTINVRSTVEGGKVVVSVADTGKGMTPEVQERIFEPFFTTKPVGVGTGLGLSVVHGIVESHKGEISVRSQVGSGTTFTLSFPADATA